MKKTFILSLFISIFLQAEELKVISKSFSGNQQKGESIFVGDVVVTKGEDQLKSDRLTIYIDKSNKPTKYIAEGNVDFYIVTQMREIYKGKAQKAIYLPEIEEYQFYTKVDLIRVDEYRKISGDKVIVNSIKGSASAQSATNEPVIMIFDLKDKDGDKK